MSPSTDQNPATGSSHEDGGLSGVGGAVEGAFRMHLSPPHVALQPFTDIKEMGVKDDSTPWI